MKLSKKKSTPLWVQYLTAVVIATGGAVTGTQPASAGTVEGAVCLADQYTGGGSPNCTANDVKVAGVAKDNNGNYMISPTSCIAGSSFPLTATFLVVTTSQSRYDIGIYFDIGGDGQHDGAKTGFCSLSTIPNSPNPPYFNLDGDFCGDTTQGSALLVPVTIPNVSCTDTNGDGLLDLPNAVSWQQNSGTVCSDEYHVTAGSPSKCKLDNAFNVPITVERPNIQVTKTANPTQCDEPGCSVTFTVHVVNPATAVSVTLSTIVDDPDNDPGTSNSVTYQASAICGKTLLGPNNDSTDCTFTRTISGNAGQSFTDKACVNGTDSNSPPNPVGPACNTASVSINDVLPTATLEKTAKGGVCAVERFEVKVTNTNAVEDLTLTALNDDKFGDITSLQGDVYGTTCGVTNGIGTLTGVTGPGPLGAITANGGTYICQFDGFICKSDLPHTNKVTGTLNDNDGNTIHPDGSATVNSPISVSNP